MDILRYITAAKHAWDEWLPQIACSLNSSLHSTINESPYFVLFGSDQRLPYDFLHRASQPVYNLDDYVKCKLRDFQLTHKLIHDRLTASQADMLRKQHDRAQLHSIEIGDIVFSRLHDRNSKLDPLFTGPYRVLELLQGHKIKILDLKTLLPHVVHKDHLKRVSKGFDDDSLQPLVPSTSTNSHLSPDTTPDTHSLYRQKLRSFHQTTN